MSSPSEKRGGHCPSSSCNEQVQSNWKTCPFCSTPLTVNVECQSEKKEGALAPDDASKDDDGSRLKRSSKDSFELADESTGIDIGSVCIAKPEINDPTTGNEDTANASDLLEEPKQELLVLKDICSGSDYEQSQNQEEDGMDHSNLAEFVKAVGDAVRKDGIANLSKIVTDDTNKWKDTKVNIAVIGESGVGKSSFINAIRGLKKGDKGYAETGTDETTTTIQRYPDSEHPNLVFWDLPGVGTPKFPQKTYLEVIEVTKYDFFILMSANRFKDNDLWLTEQISHLGKNFYFVRSKIDQDVKNEFKKNDGKITKMDIFDDLRNKTITKLKAYGIKNPIIFLINNNKINEYDFHHLLEQLMNDSPCLVKETFVMTMKSLSKEILDQKRKFLKRRIYRIALLSSAGAAIPIPGTGILSDISIFVSEVLFYKKQFGTDDRSLELIADKFKMSITEFLSAFDLLKTYAAQSVVETVVIQGADNLITESLKFVPIIGSLAASLVAYPFSVVAQNRLLDTCYGEALRVLDIKLKQIANVL